MLSRWLKKHFVVFTHALVGTLVLTTAIHRANGSTVMTTTTQCQEIFEPISTEVITAETSPVTESMTSTEQRTGGSVAAAINSAPVRSKLAPDAAYDGAAHLIAAIDRYSPVTRIRIGTPVLADTLEPRIAAQVPPSLDERLAMVPKRVDPKSWEATFRRYVSPISLDRIRQNDSDVYEVPDVLTVASTLRSGRGGVFMIGLRSGEIKLIARGIGVVDFNLTDRPFFETSGPLTTMTPETNLPAVAVVGLELRNAVQIPRQGLIRPTLVVTRANGHVEHYVLTADQWAYFFNFQAEAAKALHAIAVGK